MNWQDRFSGKVWRAISDPQDATIPFANCGLVSVWYFFGKPSTRHYDGRLPKDHNPQALADACVREGSGLCILLHSLPMLQPACAAVPWP